LRNKVSYDNLISIVIIYNPDFNQLRNIIRKQLANFKNLLLINNSPEFDLSEFNCEQIEIINNSSNFGIAKALNIGILEAKKKKFQYVALFDQDTFLPLDCSKKMINFINNYENNNACLFCPNFYNLVTNRFNKIKKIKLFRCISYNPDNELISYPSYSITSGSFINLLTFKKIGFFDEKLFIDLVDTEWCLRAQSYGYKIVQNNALTIRHSLGESHIELFNFKIQIHSPLRLYYYFRNSIYLYTLPHIFFNWVLIDFFKNILRFIFYILFVQNRRNYFKYIIKGYYHGLIKKMGKLED
jgi:rhamnosyltransferase